MLALITGILNATFLFLPLFGWDVARTIHVNCDGDRVLQRVLGRSYLRGEVDIAPDREPGVGEGAAKRRLGR